MASAILRPHLGPRRLYRRSRTLTVHRRDALCTTAQTVTSPSVTIVLRRGTTAYGSNHMLFIVGVVVVLITVVIIPRVRVPGGVNGSALGWMSEQWLADHRASHSA